jgi:O-antigen ligase
VSVRSRLALPSDLSNLLLAASLVYLGHIVYQAKPAPSEIGVAGTLIFLIAAWSRKQIVPSFHILYFPLAVYGVASTISSLVAPRRVHHDPLEIALWLKMLLFAAALTLFRTVPRLRSLAVYAHAICATWIAGEGLLQFLSERQRDLEHRITGPSTHVMTYSGLLLPLSLFLIILSIHKRKAIFIAPAVLATGALLLTFTRSAWLGWLSAILVLIVAVRPRWTLVAIPALIVAFAILPMSIFSRAVSSFDTTQASNLDRIRMLQAGVEMVRDYPLFGVGPANVKPMYPLYRLADAPRFRPPHLHNNVMQIWAERGILALAAYLLLLALFIRECVRAWNGPSRMWAQIGIAVTVAMTVAGLFEFNFGDTEPFLLLMDVFALVIASTEAPQVSETAYLRPKSPLIANEAVAVPVGA